ncbi:hypothetical protein E8E13_000630 [Curvularia kusanoi]|uniref:Rhodopsin domain-containing protein n=1 Tax=Curvularia kusanoi TaxID=90978 RepID=A0A9P4T4P9_CURKU|nr:hypothetical protein E8E13_000630 [Curvularia kusanoi]
MSLPPMSDDPTARLIAPDGLPLAIIAISVVFFVLSIIAVSLRTFIRVKKGTYSIDDAFMTFGTIVYIPVTGLAIYGCLVGLGRMNKDLNAWQQAESIKIYIVWILLYVVALATVKSSVCITIRRIASIQRSMKITVWCLLGLTWASFLVTFIGTITYCNPTRSLWTPSLILSGKGECAAPEVFLIIAHTATVSTIVTDMALVVVPALILWNTQMKRQSKIQAFALLSFASLASIITMVRIPYVNKFESQTNLPYWVSIIMLCSNVETGIGCFASSIPSLRHYFVANADGTTDPQSKRHISSSKLITGNSTRTRGGRDTSNIGFSLTSVGHAGKGDTWERLQDGHSEEGILPLEGKGIYAERSYHVESERV